MADVSVNTGPPQASKSYLNIRTILEAAKATGADAIHPGYGFLSENAAFADEVEAKGLVFVGPTGATIRTMGDKTAARGTAQKAAVPVVPGSNGRLSDLSQAICLGDEIGYPVAAPRNPHGVVRRRLVDDCCISGATRSFSAADQR